MSVKTPEGKCPACGRAINMASFAFGDELIEPGEGDVSICFRCGHLMAFNADNTLRRLTDEEMREAKADPDIAEMIDMLKAFNGFA